MFLWLGLILVVVGWYTGSNSSGTSARTTVTGGLESIGAAQSDGSATGRWAAANARWLRIAVCLLGAIVLLWGNDVSLSRLLWSLLLVRVLLSIVQILIGSGDAPEATTPTAETRSPAM